MIPTGANDDLRWTASCYVLGELSFDETARFEALLVEDQSARDALADAVAMLQAVSVSRPMDRSRTQSRMVLPFAVVLALCLLVGVGVYFAPTTRVADARRAAPDDAWILELPELLQEQAAAAEFSEPVDEEAEAVLRSVAEEADAEVPGWLILATSKEGAS